jgi:PAS domain S-box-containing protein
MNKAGQIVLARFLDSKTNTELPIPLNDSRGVPLAKLFIPPQSLLQPLSGILTLPSGPVMVAVHSILDATGKDSSIGVLMVGKSLDSSELRRLERITRLNLAFYCLDDETAPQDFKAAAASLSPQRPVLIRQLEETVTAGYTLLQDIHGSPALIFRAINPSAHQAHILTNMRSFIVPVSVVGFGVTLLTLLLLEKLILSRLARLSAFVQTVRSTENLSARATIRGKDEVSALATAVNGMLEVLEKDVAARRRVEQALRESEERLKQIVQNMPVLLLAMDERGNILAWNRECERVTGYREKEMMGNLDAMAGLYPDPAYRERFLARWREDGGDFFHEEWTLTAGDGRLKTVAWSNVSSRLPISGWTTWGTGVDITERKRTEEELRRYELLSRYARDIILFVRLDGQIAETNDEAVRAYGYSRNELLGLNVRDLRAPTNRAAVELQMEEANVRGILFQTVHLRKDGSTFPVEVSSRGAYIGDERFILSIVRDISDRMAADEALKKSEATLKSLLMAAPIGIGLVADRVLGLINAHMLNMLGYTDEELQGKSSRILYENDEEYDRVGEIKYSEIHRSGSGSIETQWRCKNGKVLDILLKSNAINRQDFSQGTIFTALDITERRRAEEEKRRLETQILHAQKLESLGVLAGGIAHDFNNLLMAILGNADLALLKISPSDPARDNMISIMEASQRAADLCLQMLAYSGTGCPGSYGK